MLGHVVGERGSKVEQTTAACNTEQCARCMGRCALCLGRVPWIRWDDVPMCPVVGRDGVPWIRWNGVPWVRDVWLVIRWSIVPWIRWDAVPCAVCSHFVQRDWWTGLGIGACGSEEEQHNGGMPHRAMLLKRAKYAPPQFPKWGAQAGTKPETMYVHNYVRP
jgi:hypothetical protein